MYASRVHAEPLTGNTVTWMLHTRARAAGLPAERFTAHSLRAGHATTAALAGVPLERIVAQTRHLAPTAAGVKCRLLDPARTGAPSTGGNGHTSLTQRGAMTALTAAEDLQRVAADPEWPSGSRGTRSLPERTLLQ